MPAIILAMMLVMMLTSNASYDADASREDSCESVMIIL